MSSRDAKMRDHWRVVFEARKTPFVRIWSLKDILWLERLFSKTRRTKPRKDEHAQDVIGPCWTFVGYIKNSHGRAQENGYPYMRYGEKLVRAHKHIMWLLGYDYTHTCVTEHLCRNRRCVNPQHLEVISIQENTIRGLTGEQLRTGKCRTCGSTDGRPVRKHNHHGKHIHKWVCRPCRNKRKREQYQRRKQDARKSPKRARATAPAQHELLRGGAGGVRLPHEQSAHGERPTRDPPEQEPASLGDQAP